MDWADEIAYKLRNVSNDPFEVAAALRKAKADGVRLVSHKLEVSGSMWSADWALKLADKIEKGNP